MLSFTGPHALRTTLLSAFSVALVLLLGSPMAAAQSLGDATAKLTKGTLVLKGDADANFLTLTGAGQDILITASLGSTLNGDMGPSLFTDVKRIKIRDEGNMVIDLVALDLPGDLSARFDGEGVLRALISTFGRNFSVRGKGDLEVSLDDSVVAGNLTTRPRGPTGALFVRGSVVARKLTLKALDGEHSATIENGSDVGKNASLRARDGQLEVLVGDGSDFDRSLDMRLRDGDLDVLITDASIVTQNINARLRDGDGSVTLSSNVKVGQRVTTRMRDGDHRVRMLSEVLVGKNVLSVFRQADPESGEENDFRVEGDCAFNASIDVRAKSGPTFAILQDAQIEKRLTLKLGSGPTVFATSDITVKGLLNFVGSKLVDEIALISSFIGSGSGVSTFKLSAGDNDLVATGTVFDCKLSIKAGSGDDVVDLMFSSVTGGLKVKLGKGEDVYLTPSE